MSSWTPFPKKIVIDIAFDSNKLLAFPAQRVFISTTQPIAHDITNVLIVREAQKEIHQYYEKHHNVQSESFSKIDWVANKMTMPNKHETSYRKTFHNFRNTMSINAKWKCIDSDNCPMCQSAPETIHRLMSCTHKDIKYVRDAGIQKIFKLLQKLNTKKEIVDHWKTIYNSFTTNATIQAPPMTMGPATWTLIQASNRMGTLYEWNDC